MLSLFSLEHYSLLGKMTVMQRLQQLIGTDPFKITTEITMGPLIKQGKNSMTPG